MRPTKKKRLFTAGLLAIILMLLSVFSGCKTTEPVKPTVRPSWPEFPNPKDSVTMMEAGTLFRPAGESQTYKASIPVVLMSLEYWLAVTAYQVDVEKVRNLLELNE